MPTLLGSTTALLRDARGRYYYVRAAFDIAGFGSPFNLSEKVAARARTVRPAPER